MYHSVVIPGVAIEPNLGDVRGGQSKVRARPDVREALRGRLRNDTRHQIWVGARLVIVRRDQDPAVLIFEQAVPLDVHPATRPIKSARLHGHGPRAVRPVVPRRASVRIDVEPVLFHLIEYELMWRACNTKFLCHRKNCMTDSKQASG